MDDRNLVLEFLAENPHLSFKAVEISNRLVMDLKATRYALMVLARNKKVIVEAPNGHNSPRVYRHLDPKTLSDQNTIQCMMHDCENRFVQEWIGHRVCDNCKRSEAWRDGDSAYSVTGNNPRYE